jgi:hypothetical protein
MKGRVTAKTSVDPELEKIHKDLARAQAKLAKLEAQYRKASQAAEARTRQSASKSSSEKGRARA